MTGINTNTASGMNFLTLLKPSRTTGLWLALSLLAACDTDGPSSAQHCPAGQLDCPRGGSNVIPQPTPTTESGAAPQSFTETVADDQPGTLPGNIPGAGQADMPTPGTPTSTAADTMLPPSPGEGPALPTGTAGEPTAEGPATPAGDGTDTPAADNEPQPQPPSEPAAMDPNSATPASDGEGFVGQHGALHVEGNRIVDRNDNPIQLRGMSWFWSQWTDFYVAQNVDVMVDDWQATLVRAALGVENDDGYLVSPQANVAKVRAIVDRAIERGVYVIIDWHDHNAHDHVAQAKQFFQEMAQAYGQQPHVIFEIYNEPERTSWPVVKTYAEDMIRTIRDAGSENLIIVGTPTWSQDVDIAAQDPITSDDNIAYTLHFYANTDPHKQPLRDKAKAALDSGIALFVTEWGTCSADGNGDVNESETRVWLSFLEDNGISWANWALNNKAEACSAVAPSSGSVGPWQDSQLTASGRLVKSAIP